MAQYEPCNNADPHTLPYFDPDSHLDSVVNYSLTADHNTECHDELGLSTKDKCLNF